MRILSQSDIEKLLKKTEDEINRLDNESKITEKLENICCEITSATISKIWFNGIEDGYLVSKVKDLKISIQDRIGIIGECFRLRLPLIINEVGDSSLYYKTIDNIENDLAEHIMVYPIIDSEEKIIAIIETIITKGHFHQFIKDDLKNLEMFSVIFLNDSLNIKKESKEKLYSQYDIDEIVKNRTKELKKAKEIALNEIKAKDRYFAEMVHELRTPLNAILGFSELLKSDERDKEKRDYITSILHGGDGMLEIINDILDFSKAQSGEMLIVKEEFSPIDEFESLATLFSSRMTKKQINFNTFIDPNLPKVVKADKKKIKQILTNLIGNAIKFTPYQGSIDLDIEYDQSSCQLDFSVNDSGIGIEESRQKAIFDPFAQEDDTTSVKFGGTGLGLNISQRFVSILGSKLEVKSKKGEGAKFYFSLKCSKDNELEANEKVFEVDKLKDKKFGILFSCDYEETAELLGRYCEKLNITDFTIYENSSEIPSSIDNLICSIDSAKELDFQKLDSDGIHTTIFRKNFLEKIDGIDKNRDILTLPLRAKKLYNSILNTITKEKIQEIKKVKKIVAVIDDNGVSANYLKIYLEKLGATVILGKDGTDAVRIYRDHLEANDIDIFFIDEYMQNMNGTEATQEIIKISKEFKVEKPKIVGISGSVTDREMQRMKSSGFDCLMTKPFKNETIREFYLA